MENFRPVVILDDDSDDLMLMEEAYHLSNCTQPLFSFTSVDELFLKINQMEGFVPSVVICDWVVPPYTGEGLLKQKQSIQKLQSVPFVFVSSSVNELFKTRALQLGATECHEKPSSFKEVVQLMNNLLLKYCSDVQAEKADV